MRRSRSARRRRRASGDASFSSRQNPSCFVSVLTSSCPISHNASVPSATSPSIPIHPHPSPSIPFPSRDAPGPRAPLLSMSYRLLSEATPATPTAPPGYILT
ncbi:hypothetical protein EYF80_056403 [Liparis tanakae]|uniref:Uncharacterized protein n=1 Tax=Liparis tanakae TaxID=230148 RepID=A0A4Z2EXF3_9TELE|nr:hypothetical protein EYF80_056403 [Liparis tanakae]